MSLARADRRQPVLTFPGPGPGLLHPEALFARASRIPPRLVLTYFPEAVAGLVAAGELRPLLELGREGAAMPFYLHGRGRRAVVVGVSGVGAPLAVMVLEELVARGVRAVVSVGAAGTLDPGLAAGQACLPRRALRAEGTSWAYQARGRWSRPHPVARAALAAACRQAGLSLVPVDAWTTDAVYRETPALVRRRRAEGCRVVDMEAAALFAAARLRDVRLGVLLYAGDDVSGPRWRPRRWNRLTEVRARLLAVALAAVRRIDLRPL